MVIVEVVTYCHFYFYLELVVEGVIHIDIDVTPIEEDAIVDLDIEGDAINK
jgi:hypothetical protein